MAAAGTLEIQLIADVARLQKDMRAMQSAVDAATGDMTNGFNATGKAAKAANDNIGNLAVEADRLRAKIDPMYTAQKRFNQEMDAADALLKKGMISTREHAAAVNLAKSALQDHAASVTGNTKALGGMNPKVTEAGEASKLSRHHVMNLGYQFQDLFVSLASGQKPTTVFIQQGSQIASVMADAGVGVGGVVKQFALMGVNLIKAHPVMTAVVTAATALGIAFNSFTDELSKTAKLDEYANSLGLTEKEMKKLGPTSITAMDAIKGIWRTVDEGLGLSEVFNTVGKWFSNLFSSAWGWAKDAAMNIYGALAASFDSIVYVWKNFPKIIGDVVISGVNMAIDGVNGLINRAIDAMNGLAAKANTVLKLVNLPTIPELDDVQIGKIANQYAGAATSIADVYSSSFAKRTQQAASTLKAVGDAFSENIIAAAKDRLDASAKDIIGKRTEDDTKEKAGKAGKDAGEEFARKFAEALQQSLSVLSGVYNEFEINARMKLEVGADVAELTKQMNDARKKQWEEEQKALKDNFDFANKAAADIASLIGGSFGAGLSDLMKTLSKDFPVLVADLGGIFKNLKTDLDVFLNGLGTSLQDVIAGIGIGSASAKMTGGNQVTGAVGGILGNELGKTLGSSISNAVGGSFGKLLGSAAGPLGAIAGGILGGIVGGLFKKTKQASATIEAAAGGINVAGIVGNDGNFKAAVSGLAKSVISGIEKIAQSLGGEIEGAFKMSIGQRDKKFVVDPFGQGRTKGSGVLSFETEAEAIAYAIDSAIRGGILGGLKTGTQALLRGAGDLEDRLQKALDFEGVFNALKGETNPLGLALENLDKRFKALILTFQEAGASSEDWAALEKYYQIEREKAIREGNAKALEAVNAARDKLTEAYNRESEAILTTLERFQNLTADLESFRLSLSEQLMTAEQLYQSARDKFTEVAKLAEEGNAKAIEQLVSVSQKYLDAAKNFLTPEDYNREIQNVMKAVDLAIVQTKTMEDYAQLQLDALNNSVDGLITLNDSVLSVRDAIASLSDAQSKVGVAPATTLVFAAPASNLPDFTKMSYQQIVAWYMSQGGGAGGSGGGVGNFTTDPTPAKFASGGYHSGGLRLVGENGPELEATGASRIYNADQTASILGGNASTAAEVASLREEMRLALYQIAKNTGKTSDQLQRWDGDGMPEARVVA